MSAVESFFAISLFLTTRSNVDPANCPNNQLTSQQMNSPEPARQFLFARRLLCQTGFVDRNAT
jgi:hypothetical protein